MKFRELLNEEINTSDVYHLAKVVERIGSDLMDLADNNDNKGIKREIKALEKVLVKLKG